MNRLNADGHDESQYLPKGMPPVNPFRANHGNVKWEGEAIREFQWLPDILHNYKIIEKCHLDTALSFYTAYLETLKALKIGDIKGILHDKPDELSAPRGDVFMAVMQGLCRPEANMLMWLVCDDRNRSNVRLAKHLIGTIKHALDNAQIIIDNMAARFESELSPLPEVSLKSGCP